MESAKHTLHTERVTLRPVTDRDVAVLLRHWSDAAISRYLFDDRAIDLETVGTIVKTSDRDFASRGYGLWAITSRADRRLIGVCGVRDAALGAASPGGDSMPEIFYSLKQRFWGQGLATEAVQRILRYLFDELQLPAVCAASDTDNPRSNQLLRRMGMRSEEGGLPRLTVTRERFRAVSEP